MRKLQAKWAIKGKLTLTDLSENYYVARFSSKQNYEFVMTQGPWMIDDHYLTIRKWIPNFTPSADNIKFLTAWVRIPNLPVEYFNEMFLKKIGSKIGKVIRVDKNTASAERGQFTRLNVEVDISKPLLSKFRLYGKVYGIQYEGLKMICFSCGKLGHGVENCPKNIATANAGDGLSTPNHELNVLQPEKNSLETGLRPEEKDDFGEWMMVRKPLRRKPTSNQANPGSYSAGSKSIFNYDLNPKVAGSRFDILGKDTEISKISDIPNSTPIFASTSNAKGKSNLSNTQKISQRINSLYNQANILLSHKDSTKRSTKYIPKTKILQTQNPSNIPQKSNPVLQDITNSLSIPKPSLNNLGVTTSETETPVSTVLEPSPNHLNNEPSSSLILSRPPLPQPRCLPQQTEIFVVPPTQTFTVKTWPEMPAPFMVVMISECPIVDIKFELAENNPANLQLEVSIPWSIDNILKLVSRAYLSSLNYCPDFMSTQIPNLCPNLPHITLLVWNVQGTGNKNKINAIKEVVRLYKPTVFALVETHMGGEHAIKLGNIIGYDGNARINTVGFSGGIWLYWKTELISVTPIVEHQQLMTVEIARNGDLPWFFSAVYASPDPTNRRELWVELENFARNNNHPWMLAGDFNETRNLNERHGGDQNMMRRCEKFNEWIEQCELIELAFSGSSHTWARGNSLETRQSARLDRALCNSSWSTLFENALVRHLPAFQSDHCPLLISPNGFAPVSNINRPFKFQACWLKHENFTEFIEENWPSNGIFTDRLDKLSKDLQEWNKQTFGNIFRKKRELIARIGGCQRELSRARIGYLIKLEAKLRRELDDILEQEELLWYQKSRLEYIKDGDRNTSYFHVSTLVRRWRNKINMLKNADNEWVDNPSEVKQIIVDYYKKLYTEEGGDDEDDQLPWDLFQAFNNKDWEWLTRPFSIAEIESVINHMGSLKAPGPDGFQALFYQKNWSLISESLCDMVIKALEGKGFSTGLNDTHIVLIPKVTAPEMVSQFRPIGLCNVAYKIISKTLANRIKKVLPHLISETQSGFVPGRQITDNIVVFQEAIHSIRKKKGRLGYMAIKIDLEKAYDRLKWEFIRDTMSDMIFPQLIIDVVMECVTTARMPILWNGEPTEQFTPTRGVRQGDPLSSYLFVMCLEKLQQAIDLEVRNKNWRPIVLGRGGPIITNLFFADDIVIFAEATEEQALVIKHVLDIFCKASGEKISNAKSRVFFSENTAANDRDSIRSALGFDETTDLGTYLGMPTINGRVTRHTFAHLEERVNKRLSGWASKQLSLAGRDTLVKSTLTTLVNYSMQTAKIPKTICDNIDRKTRRFLWGGNEEKKSIHLIKWDTIKQPKSKGGLGIVSARQANAAFLTKLGWRVITEPTSLWSRVLRAKYCNNRCDINIFQPKRNMSNVWAGISSQAKTIIRGTAIAVGNGRRTLFWDQQWVDGVCLSDHAIAPIPGTLINATVSDMWCEGNGWNWEQFADFLPQPILQKIASISLVPDPGQEDTLYWQGTSSGKFSLKTALGFLNETAPSQAPETPLWRTIWRLPVQQKVRMFLWLAGHGRLMVNVNRVRRNMGDNPLCPRCNEEDETIEHLLRSCQNASNDVEVNAKDWPLVFAITNWWIWKWRNNIVFGRDNENPSQPHLFLRQQFETTRKAFNNFDILIPPPRPHNVEIHVRWDPPPYGWIMLNTDGASKGNPGPAGGGGVFRNASGDLISAYYLSCGVCSSMKAELIALFAGLENAKTMNISRLMINMDNDPCIKLINEDQLVSNSLKFIVERCKRLIRDTNWTVKLEHIYREGNRAADLLAN
ncbi:uncharacterized protein LOC141590888 [Silene latifolia]|uniref:uncharacterized protein LOC141590888 n=1 Tax=Silene latifolia TaxID=37657 RepID=UPI003D7739F9